MTILTENFIISKTRQQDINSVKKLNCWGSELSDVTLIRKMLNVEVLCLSVNSITSLEDFSYCKNLQELYLRKNNIQNINEVCFLRGLSQLHSLWLAENPCSELENYRFTVLKALPHLQKLDNVFVQPEEVEKAQLQGTEIHPPAKENVEEDQEEIPQSSKEEEKEDLLEENKLAEASALPPAVIPDVCPVAPMPEIVRQADARQLLEFVRAPADPVPQCVSVLEDQAYLSDDYESSLVENAVNPAKERIGVYLPKGGKNRNSNILSAVLCLIKELDYASLEVVVTAIHCQMEEMEN